MPGRYSFLFQYRPKKTYIHRLPAGMKLCLFCFSSVLLHTPSQKVLAGYTLFLIGTAVCARLSGKTIKKNCSFLWRYTAVIFLIKILGTDCSRAVVEQAATETVFFMQKLTLILFAASIFYETTSKLEIFTLCEHLERPFRKKTHTSRSSPALIFTLMLICVPRVFEVWEQLNYAYESRTGTRRSVGNAYQRILFLLPALIENLIHFAFTAEKAFKNRTHP